jgi:hypothetical protein
MTTRSGQSYNPTQNPIMSTSYAANPFATDINPGTTEGAKLFLVATKSIADEKDRHPLTIGKQVEILDALRDAHGKYAWGSVLQVPINGDEDASTKDILFDLNSLTETLVREYTNGFFKARDNRDLPTSRTNPNTFAISPATDANDRPIFHKRVRLNMIGRWILGAFNKSALTTIKNKEHLYTWKDATGEIFLDGALMLQIIMDHINPSTRVGVTHLKDTLRAARLANFSYNVLSLTDKMEKTYQEILSRGGTHDDYLKDVFDALASGRNKDFNVYIAGEKTRWEKGEDVEPHTLINDAVTIYNNMYVKKTWSQKSAEEEKIVALTTQLDTLKNKWNNAKSTTPNSSTDSKSGNSSKDMTRIGKYEIETWRLTKSFGPSVMKNGTQWYWCPKHMKDKGLYVTHKPDDHGKRRGKSTKDAQSKPSNENKPNLTLSDKMKAAMVSQFKISDSDADTFWSSVCNNGEQDF